MLKATQEIIDLFKEANITCWLECGGLLRFYRDNALDDDIDFGLFSEDFDRTLALLAKHPDIGFCKKWRREIVLNYKGFQVDLFFCDVDEANLYLYMYFNGTETKGKQNLERRFKFPKEVYLPLKEYTFQNGIKTLIPNNIEKYLEWMYGDWKTPCHSWDCRLAPAYDKIYLEKNINYAHSINEKTYKLTILGYPVEKPSKIGHCFQMLTYGLYNEFYKLPHVELEVFEIKNPYSIPNDIPQSDFILATSWGSFFRHKPSIEIIRSKCKKFVSFLEIAEPCDFSFNFIEQNGPKITPHLTIPAPYAPELYLHEVKEPKTILVDHLDVILIDKKIPENTWQDLDLTKKIYSWLEPLKEEYKIYAFYPTWYAKILLPEIPSYITPVPLTNFADYLKFISKIEQLINPNKGTYPYTVLDMIIMGSRVLTPPGFVPQYQIDRFNIPTFKNQEELINELKKPINLEILNKNTEKCTPMDKAVKIIDAKFQELL